MSWKIRARFILSGLGEAVESPMSNTWSILLRYQIETDAKSSGAIRGNVSRCALEFTELELYTETCLYIQQNTVLSTERPVTNTFISAEGGNLAAPHHFITHFSSLRKGGSIASRWLAGGGGR
eukprot:scaffold17529_cov72-Skeletonema_dohrnii-CCMP3373.AAC.2